MRRLALAAAMTVWTLPAWADARMTVLADALHLTDVIAILRAEGLAYGRELDSEMLDGKGGAFFGAQVSRIYDRQRMEEKLRRKMEEGMAPDEMEAAIAFFSTPEGQEIVELENIARGLMSAPEVESAALDFYMSLKGSDDPLLARVTRYVAANDLIERNVSSSMTSTVRFYTGLSDGGYYERSEAEILDDVWADQEEIRADAESWLYGFLLLAYEPLPLVVMDDYVAYSETASGRALNAALFDGFEDIFGDISYALGRAIALNAQGDET